MKNRTKQKVDDLLENFHTPLYNANKMISFIFGAGINFNIAQGAKTWKGLSLNEAKKEFISQGKDVFESQALASKLVENVGNDKLILGLESSVSIGDIRKMAYPTKFATEFIQQLSSLMMKFNTYIGTLNYDTVLEEYLLVEGINRLERTNDYKTISKKDVINHFHGIVDKVGVVTNPRLLTQSDYVFNSEDASNALADFMEVNEENSGDKIHYVFILGANINEDHILKTLHLANDKGSNNSVKIIVFNHISGNKIIENKISDQFSEFGIDFVDFYDAGTISDDFESMWNYLVEALNTSSINSGQIKDMELVDYMSIARDIINHKKKEHLSIRDIMKHDFFKNHKDNENLEKYVAKTASYMTYRDDLAKKDFVKYLIEKEVPLSEYRNDLYRTKLTRTDLMNLTKKYEDKAVNVHSYRNEEFLYVIKKVYESDKTINFKDRPNFITKLFANGFENKRYGGHDFKRYVTNNFSVIDLKVFDNVLIRADDTPDKTLWLVKLFEKNEVSFDGVVDFSKKPSIRLYERLVRVGSYWTFWLLETDKWKHFASENFDLIEKKTLEYIKSIEGGDYRYDAFNMFSYLYMKSDNKKYLATMAKQSTFGEYPTTLNFVGHSGSYTSNYSEFDGKHFTGNIEYFKTVSEALNLFRKKDPIEYSDTLRLAQLTKSQKETWLKFIDGIAEIQAILKAKKYQYGFRKLFKQKFLISDLKLREYNTLSSHIKEVNTSSFGTRMFDLEEPNDLEEIETSINEIEWSEFSKVNQKDILNLFLYAEYKTANTWYADSYLYQTGFMRKLSFLSVNGNKDSKDLMLNIYKNYEFSEGALHLMTDGYKKFSPNSVLDLNVILHYFPEKSLDIFPEPTELFANISAMKGFDKKDKEFIRFVWNYIYVAANKDWGIYSALSIKAAKLSGKKNEFSNFFWEVHMHNFLQNGARDEKSNPPADRLVWLLRDLKDEEFKKYDDRLEILIDAMVMQPVGVRGTNDVIHLIPKKPYGEKAKAKLDGFIFGRLNSYPDDGIMEYYLKTTYETIVENKFNKSLSYFKERYPDIAKKYNDEIIKS